MSGIVAIVRRSRRPGRRDGAAVRAGVPRAAAGVLRLRALVAAATVAATASVAVVADDWPQFRGPGGRGVGGSAVPLGQLNALRAQHRAILHIAVLAEGDEVAVTAHHGVEPDAGVLFQHHGADDGSVIGDPVCAFGLDAAIA